MIFFGKTAFSNGVSYGQPSYYTGDNNKYAMEGLDKQGHLRININTNTSIQRRIEFDKELLREIIIQYTIHLNQKKIYSNL